MSDTVKTQILQCGYNYLKDVDAQKLKEKK